MNTDTARIRRRFYPKYLAIGLGMIVGGIAILITFNLIGVMQKVFVIACCLAVSVGVLVMLMAPGRECMTCS